jgi:hypothetical protein
MISALVHWLRGGAVYVAGPWLTGSPQEPTAEDDRGAGI